VENHGAIFASGLPLWDMQNTTNFINTGTMSGTAGFRFDYVHDVFLPWFNTRRDPLFGFTNSGSIFTTADLLVTATNINNFNGLLTAGRFGRVVLTSTNGHVSLFNSRVRAGDGFGEFNLDEGFTLPLSASYINPSNTVDHYWGGGDGGNLDLPFIRLGGMSDPTGHTVTNRGNLRFTELLNVQPPFDTNFPSFPGYSFFITTNFFLQNGTANPRQWRATVQMVMIQTNLPGSPEVRVYFHSQVNRNNFFPGHVTVEFGVNDFDEITGQVMSRYVRLTDRMATNVAAGAVNPPGTFRNGVRLDSFRPANFDVERSDLPFFLGGESQPATYDSNQIWRPFFTGVNTTSISTNRFGVRFETNLVPHVYSAYQFSLAPREVPPGSRHAQDLLSGNTVVDRLADPTNSPGRVEILANTLDLGNASIRADNTITIRASNITDMANARFNAQHVNIEMLSPSSSFVLSNTFPGSVARLNGQVSVWSGVWQVSQFLTNALEFDFTNVPPFFITITNISNAPELFQTNDIDYTFHLMVVDLDNFVFDDSGGFFSGNLSQLQTNQPLDLPRLRLNSANVELHDTNTVTRELFLGGDCLLIGSNGVFTLSDGLQTFSAGNAPLLTCFTNLGVFSVPQQANLGFDRFAANGSPQPYSNIVNHGSLTAGSLLFRSASFHNTSNLFAFGGPVFIDAVTNRLEGGFLFSSLRASLSGGQLLTSNAFLSVGGDLELNFTDRISDQGFTNDWFAAGGVSVLNRPPKGDLLNTRLTLTAPTNLNRTITWAGQDLGALRELVLDGSPGSLFRFRGPVPGVTNALYIHTLTLTNHTTNYATALAVDSNLKVYFAESPGVPSDKLTNAFPNRFVWVSTNTAAGPMVVVPASLAGRIQMRSTQLEALLASDPDVDGDGVPNELDETPISGFTVNDVRILDLPPRVAVVTWQGVAGWIYSLEYRDGLDAAGWTKLKTVIPSLTGTVTELDTLPPDGQRFYRVRQTRP
jgi:RES domain-containing protein